MASAVCRDARQQGFVRRSSRLTLPFALATGVGIAAAVSSGSALAQSATNACTRAYGDWVAQRDAQLQRLEPTPTLLGLDNTWCSPSTAQVTELRGKLEAVRLTCAGVGGDEKARVDSLIIRSGLLLDRVKFCAAQAVVAAAEEPWKTSVRIPPAAKPAAEKPAAAKPPVTAKLAQDQEARKSVEVPMKRETAKQETAKAPDDPPAIKETARAPLSSKSAAQPDATATVAASKPADEFDYLKKYAVQAGTPQEPAEDEDCLVVTRTSAASYLIENKNCRPQIVLTAIELNRPGLGMRCFTKKIADGIAIAGEGESAPQINFQCKEGTQGCAEGMLRGMFPECKPG
jgi:hypothetical protein